jgi:hypothetical protein
MVRRCLFEAALVLMTRVGGWSPLKAWAVRLSRLAAGGGRARAQARGHFALHLGGWHRVLVDPNRGESVIQVRRAPAADPRRVPAGHGRVKAGAAPGGAG